MRAKKAFLLTILILVFSSCATEKQSMYPDPGTERLAKQSTYPGPKTDKRLNAAYPKHRIDNKMQKVCIIGSGQGASDISSALTDMIMHSSEIKVVEPGNLQSILGGKIIEYGTGLTSEQSQALAQMFQVDHIILFEEKTSPHRDYEYGGRAYNQINLKIVNTLTGEIILQASSNLGLIFEDPRPYQYTGINERSTSEVAGIRSANLHEIAFKLRYALGTIKIGILSANDSKQVVVWDVMIDSPADRAGIQKGDKIISINDVNINNASEYDKYLEKINPKQGDILKFQVEHNGKLQELEVKLPVIPFSTEEQKQEKGKQIDA